MDISSVESAALQLCASRFGLVENTFGLISRSQGLVVETTGPRGPAIVKLGESAGADFVGLAGQLDWIDFLHGHGLRVPRLLPSRAGRFLETLQVDGHHFGAFAYDKIELGDQDKIDWHRAGVPGLAGRTMGRMHRLAREFQPAASLSHADAWTAPGWMDGSAKAFHPSQKALIPAIRELRGQLEGFPITAGSFGLIHDDFHTGNIFMQDNEMIVLDFGCAHRSWFAQDIASALVFRVWIGAAKESLQAEACAFLREFIAGYRTEAAFDPAWLEMLPALLKARELSLYHAFFGSVDFDRGEVDGFCRYVHESVRDATPFLDLDYPAIVG